MGIDVLTNRYNNERTGANLNETVLNQSNVNVNGFGKIFARGVDGQIYAQPLIVSDLEIPGLGKRSIVIIATTRNMVYAFDAENPEACHPIWRVDCDGKFGNPVPRSDYGAQYTIIFFYLRARARGKSQQIRQFCAGGDFVNYTNPLILLDT